MFFFVLLRIGEALKAAVVACFAADIACQLKRAVHPVNQGWLPPCSASRRCTLHMYARHVPSLHRLSRLSRPRQPALPQSDTSALAQAARC